MPDADNAGSSVAAAKASRGSYIGHANREMKNSQSLLAAASADLRALNNCHFKLSSYYDNIKQLSSEIAVQLAGVDEALMQADIDKYSAVVDKILNELGELKIHIDSVSTPQTPSATVSHSKSIDSVKLPKFQIATFSGDPMKWQQYWDTFKSSVHSNKQLPDIDKFTYLRSFLSGDALRLTEGYSLTSVNYNTVIDVLTERFGDPELAIFFHFDSMLALPIASNKVEDLQRVANECEVHIRSLVELGLSVDTFGRVFTPIMLSKLPPNIRVELHRAKGPGKWTLDKLRELLKNELYAREMSLHTFGQNVSAGNQYSSGARSSPKGPPWRSGAAFMSSTGSGYDHNDTPFRGGYSGRGSQPSRGGKFSRGGSSPRGKMPAAITCDYCHGQHYSNNCRVYPDLPTRRAQLDSNCCFVCLQGGHFAKFCPNKQPCFYCKDQRHHQSLCPTRFGKKSSGAAGGSDRLAAATSTTKPDEVKEVTAYIASHGRRGVLQTAITDAVGQSGAVTSRVLLDTGADTAFITHDLINRIKPRHVGSEWLAVAGFAAPNRKPKQYESYEFQVTFRDGRKMVVQAYGTDVIVPGIKKHALSVTSNPVLVEVPLAEPLAKVNEQINVDICLGSDYYYEIVKPGRIPLNDGGLCLLDTEFGYVVAGSLKDKSKMTTHMLVSRGPTLSEPSFDLERFWRLEDIGINDRPETTEDEIAINFFNDTVQFNELERRYEVKWPVKQPMPDLPSNFKMTLARLKSMVAQIEKKPEVVTKYQENYDAQIEKSVIEEAPELPDGEIIHYLPHHPVFTPDKVTTKVRIV